MKTADFDYDLPADLIAQAPPPRRTAARLLALDRVAGAWQHRTVLDFPALLRPGDTLVLNDTRVIPARVFGRKTESAGRVEVLLLEEEGAGLWTVLVKAAGRPRPGLRFTLADGEIRGAVDAVFSRGRARVRLDSDRPLADILEEKGLPPLPPYIRRPKAGTPAGANLDRADRERYQTVYARTPGSAAAPTAGLHFTEDLLAAVRARGVRVVTVTLHVGLGTFKPIVSEDVEAHEMHEERYEVPERTAAALNRTRADGGRIVAVGTTAARVLETAADESGCVRAGAGRTGIFIRHPYRFRAVDALLTNFHLPRSSLLVMVSALAGRELVLRAYAEAVRQKYRFFSYGDCMFII